MISLSFLHHAHRIFTDKWLHPTKMHTRTDSIITPLRNDANDEGWLMSFSTRGEIFLPSFLFSSHQSLLQVKCHGQDMFLCMWRGGKVQKQSFPAYTNRLFIHIHLCHVREKSIVQTKRSQELISSSEDLQRRENVYQRTDWQIRKLWYDKDFRHPSPCHLFCAKQSMNEGTSSIQYVAIFHWIGEIANVTREDRRDLHSKGDHSVNLGCEKLNTKIWHDTFDYWGGV